MRRPFRGFLILTVLLLAPGAVVAQPQRIAGKPIEIPGDGTQVFRGLLDMAGIKPVTKEELKNLPADRNGFGLPFDSRFDDIILISLGKTNQGFNSPNPLQYLPAASNRGGALIATDSFLPLFSSIGQQNGHPETITGEHVQCSDARSVLREKPYCPFIVLTAATDTEPALRPFKGLKRIATNVPSYMTVGGWAGDCQFPLATFPRNCTYGDFDRPLLGNAYFAVGGVGPEPGVNPFPYRFLMMADHSVFINQMLLEPGTDNLVFAQRVIEYLQGPNKRKRCIFFEDGQLIERFDDLRQAYAKQNQTPLPQVNLWNMQEKLTDLGNTIIDRLETNDAANKFLFGSRDGADQHRILSIIMRFFLIVATVLACLYVLRRAWSARKPNDIPPAPAVAGAPSGPPGVFDRRQKELLRRNNVYEPVRDLMREFFESVGVHGTTGPKHPKLVISDVVRKPDSLRAAIKDLWKLAYGPPQVLTVNRWRELEPYFERVRQAHTDGKWHFIIAEATAGSVA